MSEQELFNNASLANVGFIVNDSYNSEDVNISLGFAVNSPNFSGKTLTRILLYGGSNGLGAGTLRMWIATSHSFVSNPNDGVTISARTYSTNTQEISTVNSGSYEFTFSGLILPADSVLMFGLEITNGCGTYQIVFGLSGVNTGSHPLYIGDVTSVPSNLDAEVNNFQPVCIIYGTTPTTYSVTYNGNGNTSGSAPTDPNNPYLNTASVTIMGQGTLTKTNNIFIGWSTNSNATTAQYTQGQTFVINSNTALYAVWAPPRTITYDGNGVLSGTAPVDSNSPYQHGSTVTVLGNTGGLWHELFNFAGWSTEPSDIWPTYAPGETFTITEDIVLYAIWLYGGPPVGNQYIVNYNKNGSDVCGSVPIDYNVYQSGNAVTVLGNTGFLLKPDHIFLGWSTNSAATVAQYTAGSTFNIPPNSVTLYAVWGYVGDGPVEVDVDRTVSVAVDECYTGSSGSKGTVLNYVGVGNTSVVSVVSNLPSNMGRSAVIENLVIDCKNKSGMVGILLEDVSHCLVRNVTIMNCDVGIKVRLTGSRGVYAQGNRFEHICLVNVKIGILFEGAVSARDFSFTVVDDVGISLGGNLSDVGIKVGAFADLFSVFVRANVWLNGSNGVGLSMENGTIRFSLVNLAVEEFASNSTGKGIVLNSGADISDNQSFMLACLGIDSNNKVVTSGGGYSDIKFVPQ